MNVLDDLAPVAWVRTHIAQLARYASVSVIATVVGLTVLGVLVTTRTLTPGWANVVATSVGTVPSFELNRRWVWGKTGTRSLSGEVVPFAALSFVGLALSTAAVSLAGHLTVDAASLTRTLILEAANVGSFGVLWVLQFVILDRLLFIESRPIAALSNDDPRARAA
jgi:putative flippase GtrA